MRKNIVFPILLVLTILAGCVSQAPTTPTNIPLTATNETTLTVPTAAIEQTTVNPPTAITGTEITYGLLTLEIPSAVANGASGGEVQRVDSEEAAWWQKTPGYLEVSLGDYYILQGKTRQPRILVFPAQGYAELVPAAFESMHRLNNILGSPEAAIEAELLPAVPFFNERQAFAANIEVIAFQNGRGVRFLSEYGQAPVSANNQDLFYQFQGLTGDGAYYIVAIFPVNTPGLGDSNDPAAAVPINGIPFPTMGDPNANWEGYYEAVSQFLNGTPPDAYTPGLSQLDALVQSMRVGP